MIRLMLLPKVDRLQLLDLWDLASQAYPFNERCGV